LYLQSRDLSLTTDSQSAAGSTSALETSGVDHDGLQQQQPESTRHDDDDVTDDDVIHDASDD